MRKWLTEGDARIVPSMTAYDEHNVMASLTWFSTLTSEVAVVIWAAKTRVMALQRLATIRGV
jgi:hypothetical protein